MKQTVGEILIEASEKAEELHELSCQIAHLVARCNPYMAEAPMKEAGDAVVATDELRKVLSGIARVARAIKDLDV